MLLVFQGFNIFANAAGIVPATKTDSFSNNVTSFLPNQGPIAQSSTGIIVHRSLNIDSTNGKIFNYNVTSQVDTEITNFGSDTYYIVSFAYDSHDNLYANTDSTVYKLVNNAWTTYATDGSNEFDGTMKLDRHDNIFIYDGSLNGAFKIKKIAASDQTVTHVAGTGTDGDTGGTCQNGEGGSALAADLCMAYGMAFRSDGSLFINSKGVLREIKPVGGEITASSTIHTFIEEVNFTAFEFDKLDNIYAISNRQITDECRIKKILNGTTTEFFYGGMPSFCAYRGDGVPVSEAYFKFYADPTSTPPALYPPVILPNGIDFYVVNDQPDLATDANAVVRKVIAEVCEQNYYSPTGLAITIDGEQSCYQCPLGSSTQGKIGQYTCVCDYGWGETGYGETLNCVESCLPLYYDPSDRKCKECDYPYISSSYDPEECYFVWINLDEGRISSMMSVLGFFYLLGFMLMKNKKGNVTYEMAFGLFLYTLMPALDVFTDLVYLMTTQMANSVVFALVVFFCGVPCILFFKFLIERGCATPRLLAPSWFSLMCADGNIGNFLASLSIALPVYFVNFFLLLFWAVIGSYTWMTKLFAINNIQDRWILLWTGEPNPHTHPDPEETVDSEVLNESTFDELMFKTLGQICVQAVNNSYSEQWGFETYASFVVSVLTTLDGIYQFVYNQHKGLTLAEIPVDVKVGFVATMQTFLGFGNVDMGVVGEALDTTGAEYETDVVNEMNNFDETEAKTEELLAMTPDELKGHILKNQENDDEIHSILMSQHDLTGKERELRIAKDKCSEKLMAVKAKIRVLMDMKILKKRVVESEDKVKNQQNTSSSSFSILSPSSWF